MQIADVNNPEQVQAAKNWAGVYELRKAWMDLDRPVDLIGRVPAPEDNAIGLLVVAEADAGDNPEVWLIPENGEAFPFSPEEYEKRPLVDVEGVVAQDPVRYDRAWDIVQEYRGAAGLR